jgi:hypothetical protein
MNFGNWWGGFGLPGGLVMSCNALRDVRTFCWISVVDIGVKNFLKRLGVMVGGLVGFLELLVLAGRAGEDTGASRSLSDMAVEILVDSATVLLNVVRKDTPVQIFEISPHQDAV